MYVKYMISHDSLNFGYSSVLGATRPADFRPAHPDHATTCVPAGL